MTPSAVWLDGRLALGNPLVPWPANEPGLVSGVVTGFLPELLDRFGGLSPMSKCWERFEERDLRRNKSYSRGFTFSDWVACRVIRFRGRAIMDPKLQS